MATADELLAIEGSLWRAAGDRDAYAAQLTAEAIHVFPGWGVAPDPDLVLKEVAEAEPWLTFSIGSPRLVDLGEGAAALVYTGRARRAGQGEYVAAITSVYRREGDRWKLVIHQQTPL